MKIGVCETDLPGMLPATLQWAAAEGIEGVQVWKHDLDKAGLNGPALRTIADDLGVAITAVGGGPKMVDPEVAADTVDEFRQFFDLAAELGTPIVTAESKIKPRRIADSEAWDTLVKVTSAICAHAESYDGAVLAIEPSGKCVIDTVVRWRKLVADVDSPILKINHDPANLAFYGVDPCSPEQLPAGEIVHVHAKDVRRAAPADDRNARMEAVAAGDGIVGYASYLRRLRDIGFDGWLTIEMHPTDGDVTGLVRRSVSNLRELIQEMSLDA